jgi:DNA-binding CsgD family transcriptional regulator
MGPTLFISANSVDYHLREMFRTFGHSSSRRLADRLDARG